MWQKISIDEIKGNKVSAFKMVSLIYFIGMGLYFLGLPLLKAANLEYRMWVSILGDASLLLGLPVWLLLLWFRWHKKNGESRVLRYFVTAAFTALFLLWSYFCFIAVIFTVQEEKSLFGRYVVVNRATFLSESDYDLCKSKGLFFREDAEWDNAFRIEYLERKYRQDFIEVPFDEENMLFYDHSGGGILDGKTLLVSPLHHQNLPVKVGFSGSGMDDNYVDLLTRWYVVEGCRELAIERPYRIMEDGNLRLIFTDSEDAKAAAADVQKLMAYAMQDEIFQDYAGAIRLSPEDGERYEYIYLSFGKVNRGNGAEYGYEKDLSKLQEKIDQQYEKILSDREERLKREKEREKRREEAEAEEAAKAAEAKKAAEAAKSEEVSESIYEKEARLIWEEARAAKEIEIEDTLTVQYNARGEKYYSLGEDGTYSYTLIYDRESKNGACSLYVLYRSPYDAESGAYYYYTDTMTQIMDIYAVVKETEEIISSGRTAWSDPGNSAYREAVGE